MRDSVASISIVIVTWNAKKFVAECLDSLEACSQDRPEEIIVVDNQSTDGTAILVRQSYPRVTLIENAHNLGFSRANNIGIRRSRGNYVCLINSDVRVLPGCIEKMTAYMENNARVGLLGPKMLGGDLKPARSYMGTPTLWRCFCRAMALDVWFPRSKFFGGLLMGYFNQDSTAQMDVLNGWFWMIRREALNDVGLLDESFFFYGEDLDWCRRFHDAGWEVVYFPKAESIHYGGASSGKAPQRFYIEMHRANYQYWKKYHGPISRFLYLAITVLEQAMRVVAYGSLALATRSKSSEAFLKARRSLACMRWIMAGGFAIRAEIE